MRVVYMGTPEIAASVLQRVIDLSKEHDIEIVGVYTQPDKPVGRKQILTPSAVKVLAEANGLPVYQPKRIKRPKPVETLKALEPDLILVTAFGQILSQEILDLPKYGCINMHASLLPGYRGAAPIQWVIVNGETETGVTAMQMDAGIDTGDMIETRVVPITEEDTCDTLYNKLSEEGANVIEDVVLRLLAGETLPRTKQDESQASYAAMITREDGLIDWNKSARLVDCQVRGFYGWPGTYSFLHVGGELKKCSILSVRRIGEEEEKALLDAQGELSASTNAAAETPEAKIAPGTILAAPMQGKHPRMIVVCGEGLIEILSLQLQGKKSMDTEPFLRGMREMPQMFEMPETEN